MESWVSVVTVPLLNSPPPMSAVLSEIVSLLSRDGALVVDAPALRSLAGSLTPGDGEAGEGHVAPSATSRIRKSGVPGAALRSILVPPLPAIVIGAASTGRPLPPSVGLSTWVRV